jgi:hypothetical protein
VLDYSTVYGEQFEGVGSVQISEGLQRCRLRPNSYSTCQPRASTSGGRSARRHTEAVPWNSRQSLSAHRAIENAMGSA